MARYKPIDTSPRFIAVDLASQLLPGTFEHALNHLLDHEIDLSGLDARYANDATGAPAYPPAVLLKLILFDLQQATGPLLMAEQSGRPDARKPALEPASRRSILALALSPHRRAKPMARNDQIPWSSTTAVRPRGFSRSRPTAARQRILRPDAQLEEAVARR